MKTIINIRGAGGSGKTTAVKQFCEKKGFTVHEVQTPFGILPVTVLTGGKIVAFGDYSLGSGCLGADRFRNIKSCVMDLIAEVDGIYAPNFLIYEYKIGSHLYKSTKEIIQVGEAYGYGYIGVFLELSERERYERTVTRRGTNSPMKRFKGEQLQCKRSCEHLVQDGHRIFTVETEKIRKEDMWKVVDFAIRKANG